MSLDHRRPPRRRDQRELEVITKKYADDASRSMLFFHAPAEVKGVGFLQWAEPQSDDQQWLWLPELKRVRQISGGAAARASSAPTSATRTWRSLPRSSTGRRTRRPARASARRRSTGSPATSSSCVPPPAADVDYGTVRLWLGRDDQTVRKFEFRDADGGWRRRFCSPTSAPTKNIPTAHAWRCATSSTRQPHERGGERATYDTGIAEDEFTERRLEKGL